MIWLLFMRIMIFLLAEYRSKFIESYFLPYILTEIERMINFLYLVVANVSTFNIAFDLISQLSFFLFTHFFIPRNLLLQNYI